MRIELITFPAGDGFPLDGLVYTPDVDESGKAALLVHGKTTNFYTGPARFLPPRLTALGWSCLAMNRRGHDLGSIRNGRECYGGAWERFGDSQLDIEGGMAELRRRGFQSAALIGHSFGGIAAAAYSADHGEEVSALGLCSAGCGGREYLPQCSDRGLLAAERHAEVDAEARRLVKAGQGDLIIGIPGWWYAITAASWVDLAENVPSTVESASRYPGPILALRGSLEPPEIYPAEQVAAAAGARGRLVVVSGSDHFYNGVEDAFTSAVCDWLRGTAGG
jgi:pimeloyl-ACP methyl ester carboxylesterase